MNREDWQLAGELFGQLIKDLSPLVQSSVIHPSLELAFEKDEILCLRFLSGSRELRKYISMLELKQAQSLEALAAHMGEEVRKSLVP